MGFRRFVFSQTVSMGLMGALMIAPAYAQQDETIPLRSSETAPPIQVDAASQEVPQGRLVKVTFLTPMDANSARVGDPFLAELAENLVEGEKLILPQGTTVRGRIEEVHSSRLFGKGAMMRLAFDHVVMPSGELEPLDLRLNATSDKVTQDRALYTDPGLSAKLDKSLDKGVEQFRNLRDKGIEAGKQRGGGLNMLLTVPTTTMAGVVAGTAVTTVNAAKAVFGHGENVMIQPGEQLYIDFAQAINLPSQ